MEIFSELGVIIIAAALFGVVGYFLKQPLISLFILAGIIIGPAGLGIINDSEFIHAVSELGIMLLLFLIGLEMNTSKLRDFGPVSVVVGIGQVLFTGIVSFLFILLFDLGLVQTLYVSFAVTLSSTVIAIKLMSEKHEQNSLSGQITVGVLIIQDIAVVVALLLLGSIGAGVALTPLTFIELIGGGMAVTFGALFFSKHVLSRLYSKIADSHELLILFSLSWCFLLAIGLYYLGFSKEIGAFIAGISLANLPYTYEISAKSKVLRDFFITIFFVSLGAGMSFGAFETLWLPTLLLSLFVLIGNPIIVMTLMKILGYDKRTSFFSGIYLANISEFAFILMALGVANEHISDDIATMITGAGIITMVVSSYMITNNKALYRKLKKYLKIFDPKKKKMPHSNVRHSLKNHIVLLGGGRTGMHVLDQVRSFKEDYMVIDYDNKVITELLKEDVPCLFGDVEDDELVEVIHLEDTELVISTLPSAEDNYFILNYIKELPKTKRPIFIAVAESAKEGVDLFERGADYVIVRAYLGAAKIHELNKSLFNLTTERHTRPLPEKPRHWDKKMFHDVEYARILNNLNELRLDELKLRRKG